MQCRELGGLPLPVWGEGWGEGVTREREAETPLRTPLPSPSRMFPTWTNHNCLTREHPGLGGERELAEPASSASLIVKVGMMAEIAANGAATRASGSSFYAAMRILPPARRQAIFEIYGFCRAVDDVADAQGPREPRLKELAQWRADVNALY